MANERLVPAQAAVAIGREETISFNRRYLMQDGTVQTSPGKADPAIVRGILRPAGPIDPDVGVVTFDEVGGDPLVTLVNFAIHLDTIGGNQPSADFPFQINTLLASVRRPDMLTVFAAGAAGNYKPLQPAQPRAHSPGKELPRIIAYSARFSLPKSSVPIAALSR